MGILGFQTRKEKEQYKAQVKAFQKLEEFASNNEWAKQVLSQISLRNGIPAFDYNLAKFINEGYIRNPNVYSVIQKIIGPAKLVPWVVYKVVDEVELKRYKAYASEGKISQGRKHFTKAVERVEGTRLNAWFEDQANPLQTWPEFVEASMGYKLLTGNDFIYTFTPTGWKYPTQLYNLPAQAVEIIPGDWRDPVSGYRIFLGDVKKPIDPVNVIHRKNFNPTFNFGVRPEDYLYGLSPLAPLCRVVKRSNESIDASLAMMMNGFPPGILSYDASPNEGNPITPKEKEEVHTLWKETYGGGAKANKPIISPVKLLWQAMGLKSADMELLDSDKASLKQIANVYNVPEPIIDQSASHYNNINTARKELWSNAIIPELVDLREALNNGPVAQYNRAEGVEYWIDFDVKAIPALQEDKEKESKRYMAEMEHGLHSPNEARKLLDYDQVDNDPFMDKRYMKNAFRYLDEPQAPKSNEQEETGETEES